MTFRQVKP